MRLVIQRVAEARVIVAGETVGAIGPGLAVLLGVTHSDGAGQNAYLVDRCLKMRIFEDDAGKMNRSVEDIGGSILVIPQFTLYGDTRSGRRPSFTEAARPEKALELYRAFIALLRESTALRVEEGRFGADMRCELVNDGPVTLIVEA